MMSTWRRARRGGDQGTSLIELMVVMIIFTIILGIITSAIINMEHQGQKENGQANDMDAARKVINLLDYSVRFANAVTLPGTGTDGSLYVEWQSGNTGQQQTCTQWRFVPTGGKLQYRTWQPPLSGVGTVTPSGWATAAIGISQVGATPVFSITSGTKTATSSKLDTKEELAVQFTATSGVPATSSSTQVTLTAINTTSQSPPLTATCTQVGRP
jgi:prepilin-type N-terminal cleavage/methylation domain-containing protein